MMTFLKNDWAINLGRPVRSIGRRPALSARAASGATDAVCYAGVWAAHVAEVTQGKVSLTPQDIEDDLRAAAAVGDDTLQRQTTGQVMPNSFTHGTSAQRMRWFRAGLESGAPAACDTFSAERLSAARRPPGMTLSSRNGPGEVTA